MEGADGEKGHVLLLFCVADEIDVDELLDLLGRKRRNRGRMTSREWGGREREREGRREGGRERRKEGGREGGKEGGRERN